LLRPEGAGDRRVHAGPRGIARRAAAFFAQDPFHAEKLASFTFSEFNPVKRQGWAEAWFAETPAD